MSFSILVVEDDRDLQEALQAILEEEGYEIDQAFNGQEGLQRVADHVPDLILLDMMMPVMDGCDFARQLRQRGAIPRVPIIVITADGRAPQRAAQIGAEGFLTKPFEVDELLRQISRFNPLPT